MAEPSVYVKQVVVHHHGRVIGVFRAKEWPQFKDHGTVQFQRIDTERWVYLGGEYCLATEEVHVEVPIPGGKLGWIHTEELSKVIDPLAGSD